MSQDAAQIMGAQGVVAATAALLVLCMGLWATGLVAEVVTALLFFAAAMLLKLAPAQTVFSGFASSAFWLVTSGMVVGLAMNRTGLGDRLARMLAARLPASYPGFVAGLVAFSFALAFVMPSNLGRIAVMVPVLIALCDAFGLKAGRPGRTGAILSFGIATPVLSAAILPANVPNLVMAGTAETLYGVHLGYLPYLFLHAPVLGFVKGAILVACTVLLFPDRLDGARPALPPLPPLSGAERRLSVILAIMLGLWLTDGWHGIAPAWIGLAAAVICLLPGIGVVSAASFSEIPLRTCFYVAALFGLTAVVNETGLGAKIGHALLSVAPLEAGAPAKDFATLVGLSIGFLFVGTANGAPALYTALAGEFAGSSGLDLMSVLMVQVVGYSTLFLPYQAPPIVMTMDLAGLSLRDATKLTAMSGLASLIVAAPLAYLWFRLTGRLA
ncbi:SLC13 family permease [Methylorubrum salsuginis]|uniref:Di-and tricarboxylate transporter n=1 Tax=Methylorubrum salsuginis TaxID=414703 RepID=A0A1I4I3N7_9HYPH|nr:SLC13 family permease [Methylorubrum salsuginis]SFL48396.1 Di-and tricarboxylate transporter [Methylorubrum salsuginis]